MASEAHHVKRTALNRRSLCSLARDQRGTTILEFAAVAAPLIALILAVLQTALVFFSQQALETSAERTARQLITGAAQSGGMTPANFKTTACNNLPAFMKCANLMIDVQNATSFASVNVSAPALTYDGNGNVTNSWGFAPGGAGSIVVMRTMYRLPVVSAPMGFNLANMAGSQRLLIATSVFKTEPYGGGP